MLLDAAVKRGQDSAAFLPNGSFAAGAGCRACTNLGFIDAFSSI
jgi:hypothetical protein